MQAILYDKLYIPKSRLPELLLDAITEQFTYKVGTDEETTYEESGPYVEFPRGNQEKLDDLLGFVERKVKVSKPKMGARLQFMGKLYPEQEHVAKKWLEARYGVFIAPTAWGKTITSLHILCCLGLRTLILVSKKAHARTWMQEIYKFTNAETLDRGRSHPVCGIYDGRSRHIYDCITVSTYQAFIHKTSHKWYVKHRTEWGTVWVDEVDEVGADVYSMVVGEATAKFRGGVTATWNRNDGLEFLVEDIIGPVIVRGKVRTLQADVYMAGTDVFVPKFTPPKWVYNNPNVNVNPYQWQWMMLFNYIAKSDKYYDLVREMLLYDALIEKRFVLAISTRNKILKELYDDLRAIPGLESRVALLIGSTVDRDTIFEKAESGEVLITLAQSSIVSRAVNVERWDCLHRLTPGAGWTRSKTDRRPNTFLEQSIGRILRRLEGKPKPVVRHYTFKGSPIMINVGKSCAAAYEVLGHRVFSVYAGTILSGNQSLHTIFSTSGYYEEPPAKQTPREVLLTYLRDHGLRIRKQFR